MDEGPAKAGPLARQVTVLGERLEMRGDSRCERIGGVAVVVKVELDLAKPCTRELRELIEEVWSIFLPREEEAVARWPSIAVTKLTQRRVVIGPRVDTRIAYIIRSAVPQRFVVIAKCEQDVSWTVRLWRTRTSNQVASVVTEPVLEIFLS